jgi:hypothetical protein
MSFLQSVALQGRLLVAAQCRVCIICIVPTFPVNTQNEKNLKFFLILVLPPAASAVSPSL